MIELWMFGQGPLCRGSWHRRMGSRANYEIEQFGDAIHWPDVDEDIGLATFPGISEDALYDALDFRGPTQSTQTYLALAD